jgi:hypothetical protein
MVSNHVVHDRRLQLRHSGTMLCHALQRCARLQVIFPACRCGLCFCRHIAVLCCVLCCAVPVQAKLRVVPWDGYLKYYNLGEKHPQLIEKRRKVGRACLHGTLARCVARPTAA